MDHLFKSFDFYKTQNSVFKEERRMEFLFIVLKFGKKPKRAEF